MYLHTKYGFVEADLWDGAAIPNKLQSSALDAALAATSCVGAKVVVARSRYKQTLVDLVALLGSAARFIGSVEPEPIEVLASPQGWDYEFRCYLTTAEFAGILSMVVVNLDYRNFKTWCSKHQGAVQYKLASDIWHAAHKDGGRKQFDLSDVQRDPVADAIEAVDGKRPIKTRTATMAISGGGKSSRG